MRIGCSVCTYEEDTKRGPPIEIQHLTTMSLSPQHTDDIDMPAAAPELVEQPGDLDEEMDDLFGEENEQNVVKPERRVAPYSEHTLF